VAVDTDEQVARLKESARQLQAFRPCDEAQRREVVDLLRRLGLLCASVTKAVATALCRTCGTAFTFQPSWYALRRLDPPKHCATCLKRRAEERSRRPVPAP
jgi:hypothetical protein